MIDKALTFSHELLKRNVNSGDVVIDATVGNGHDTLLLAQLVGETGKVIGFDIQKQAIENTQKRLNDAKVQEQVQLYQQGHETVLGVLEHLKIKTVKAAVFNLGYLPSGDKSVITTPQTTISAIEQICQYLVPEGIILVMVYHGHPGGAEERDELLTYVHQLSQIEYDVLCYQLINQKNQPPFLIAIEKKVPPKFS